MLGLSQQQLADLIGVTYQQAHKYERGLNRVSAGRLYAIARALEVEPGYFFEGLDGEPIEEVTGQRRALLELVRHFQSIVDPQRRQALASLVRSLAGEAGGRPLGKLQPGYRLVGQRPPALLSGWYRMVAVSSTSGR